MRAGAGPSRRLLELCSEGAGTLGRGAGPPGALGQGVAQPSRTRSKALLSPAWFYGAEEEDCLGWDKVSCWTGAGERTKMWESAHHHLSLGLSFPT